MSTYHKDLPKSWIEIIEKDEILKELFAEYFSEYEPVPEFLFQELRGDLDRIKPIFELYGENGIEMYEKILEIDILTKNTMQTVMEDGNISYAGYFYMKSKDDEKMARQYVLEYIKAINKIYVEEFEEEPLIEDDAFIEFITGKEAVQIKAELDKAWNEGEPYLPEMDMYEGLGDWFTNLDFKEECEELGELLEEALYHISNDYYLSYYINWSLVDMPVMENPFLAYYKLWCMGLEVRFVEKNRVIVIK